MPSFFAYLYAAVADDSMTALARFLAFYAALFAAFGVVSPFLPGLLQQDGLEPVPARGMALLVLVSVAHASVLAPLTPVADALALGSSQIDGGFPYGWVRGAGSAAFIAGTLLSGQVVDRTGLGVIVWLNAALLAVAASLAWLLPNRVTGANTPKGTQATAASAWVLLRLPVFVRLMFVAALIGGSHALHDAFEVIRWRSAGLSAQQSSILWALSVAAEIVVFVVIGPKLLQALGPSRAMVLAAMAGIIRWAAEALTAWFPAMALVEPLPAMLEFG